MEHREREERDGGDAPYLKGLIRSLAASIPATDNVDVISSIAAKILELSEALRDKQ